MRTRAQVLQFKAGNLILPFKQYIPATLFAKFSALQSVETVFILSTTRY